LLLSSLFPAFYFAYQPSPFNTATQGNDGGIGFAQFCHTLSSCYSATCQRIFLCKRSGLPSCRVLQECYKGVARVLLLLIPESHSVTNHFAPFSITPSSCQYVGTLFRHPLANLFPLSPILFPKCSSGISTTWRLHSFPRKVTVTWHWRGTSFTADCRENEEQGAEKRNVCEYCA
jgi:hypothetical protein